MQLLPQLAAAASVLSQPCASTLERKHIHNLTRLPSFMMEYDIHTLLDLLTAGATAAVLYAMLATPVSPPAAAAGNMLKHDP